MRVLVAWNFDAIMAIVVEFDGFLLNLARNSRKDLQKSSKRVIINKRFKKTGCGSVGRARGLGP